MSMTPSADESGVGSPDLPTTSRGKPEGAPLSRKVRSVAVASAAALVVGEVISLAQTVAIARLLTPAQVGIFAAGTVLTVFLTFVTEGGLRASLVHRDDRVDDAATTVFWVTFTAGVGMGLITLAVSPLIAAVFDSGTAGTVAAAMSASVALYSLTNVPEALLQRRFSVRRRVLVGPSVSLTFAVVSVSSAAAGWGVWSLVAGSYASTGVWCALVWWLSGWRVTRGRFSIAMWRELARYGAPLVIGLVADQAQRIARVGIIGHTLGATGLGLFRYGERIAKLPVLGMVEVGSNSLFPAFARIRNEPERLRHACLRSLRVLTTVASVMSFALVSVGVPLVVVVLGEQWREAGHVLVAMAGVAYGTAIRIVGEETLKGVGQTRSINVLTGIETTLALVLLIGLVGPWELVGVGAAMSVTAVLSGAVAVFMLRPLIDVTGWTLATQILPPLWSGLAALAVTMPLEQMVLTSGSRPIWLGLCFLVVDGLTFLTVYSAVMRVTAPRHAREMASLFRTMTHRATIQGAATTAPPGA